MKNVNNVELTKNLFSKDELNEMFLYHTDGFLYSKEWFETKGSIKKCGTRTKKGTRCRISMADALEQKGLDLVSPLFLASRLIWTMFNGEIPEGMVVDHINNDFTDDRIENLQLLSQPENSFKGSRFNKMYFSAAKVGNKVYVTYKQKNVKGLSFQTIDQAVEFVNNNSLETILVNQ